MHELNQPNIITNNTTSSTTTTLEEKNNLLTSQFSGEEVTNLLNARYLRKCLRIIRAPETMPSTILPNGETAERTAHMYVLQGNKKRNQQKRKREAVKT